MKNTTDFFGFTEKEIEKLLAYYGMSEKENELRDWYDGYLFGSEEIYNPWSVINYISNGIAFLKHIGKSGKYDAILSLYHDQGHIPLKVKGFVYNKELKKWDAVAGVNVTLGIPVIRVSVDHGTGFDLAGKGESNELSLVNSIDYATKLAVNKK